MLRVPAYITYGAAGQWRREEREAVYISGSLQLRQPVALDSPGIRTMYITASSRAMDSCGEFFFFGSLYTAIERERDFSVGVFWRFWCRIVRYNEKC